MQVYVDFFAIAILLLGGALACYGEQLHFSSQFSFAISVCGILPVAWCNAKCSHPVV